MIIWDEENQNHWIKLGSGIQCPKIKFVGQQTNEDVELVFKFALDNELNQVGDDFHCYLHIINKNPLDYLLWLGPINKEPSAPSGYEWWEDWPN